MRPYLCSGFKNDTAMKTIGKSISLKQTLLEEYRKSRSCATENISRQVMAGCAGRGVAVTADMFREELYARMYGRIG